MESERDETDQERVRAVRQPRRDYNAFVCVKDQRMAGVVGEPDEESNRMNAQGEAEEKWPVINRRSRNTRVRRGGRKWRRRNSGVQRGEGRDRDIAVCSSDLKRKATDSNRTRRRQRRRPWIRAGIAGWTIETGNQNRKHGRWRNHEMR
jgi:hypothetical protein